MGIEVEKRDLLQPSYSSRSKLIELEENHSIYKYFPSFLSLEKKYISSGKIFLWPFGPFLL
jgi:hypothetical protein